MKNFSPIAIAFCFALLSSTSAWAQWDYGQSSIDNGVEARIDARKTRDRIRARRGKSSKSTRTKRASSTKATKRTAAPIRVAKTVPHHDISIHHDTFQDFHSDDVNGYNVSFSFVSANGKTISKVYNYSPLKYRHVAEYNDLPTGTYTLKAVATYGGKKLPVHLGTEQGSSTNPKGGNFAPSIRLVVKPAKDSYGDTVVQGFPNTIYLRVVE